jgi:hypothetical protein
LHCSAVLLLSSQLIRTSIGLALDTSSGVKSALVKKKKEEKNYFMIEFDELCPQKQHSGFALRPTNKKTCNPVGKSGKDVSACQ